MTDDHDDRINDLEGQYGRHDERIKTMEKEIDGLKPAIQKLQRMTWQSEIRIVGLTGIIIFLVQHFLTAKGQ